MYLMYKYVEFNRGWGITSFIIVVWDSQEDPLKGTKFSHPYPGFVRMIVKYHVAGLITQYTHVNNLRTKII